MPRKGGARSAPKPAPKPATRPASNKALSPQPVHHAPPPVPVQPSSGGSIMGGLASTVVEGVAFGTGSAIAHRAVDSMMGPRVIQHEQVPAAQAPQMANVASKDACVNQYKAFQDCISNSGSDIAKCQFYMDMLSECRKAPATAAIM